MQFRDLLDLPFALIAARIKTLAPVLGAAIAVAAGLAVAGTALAALLTGDSDSGTFWSGLVVSLVCAWLLRGFVRWVTVPIGLAVVHRRPLTWRAALAQATGKSGPLLAYQVMFTLIGVGVLALGAPLIFTVPFAVIWLAWLRARRSTLVPILFEGSPGNGDSLGYGGAARRAKLLASGREWPLAGLWMYQRGLLLVLLVPLFALWQFITQFSGTHRWTVTVLLILVALLVVAFAEMVESATQVVAYVDRRCRREGWDIPVPAGSGR
ncbi:hypothetical protein [Nocardia sp. NPDC004722]